MTTDENDIINNEAINDKQIPNINGKGLNAKSKGTSLTIFHLSDNVCA